MIGGRRDKNINRIALDAEIGTLGLGIVTLVIYADQPADKLVALQLIARPQRNRQPVIFLRSAQTVYEETDATTMVSRRSCKEQVAE